MSKRKKLTGIEGIDFVVCPICGERCRQLGGHIRIHGITIKELREQFVGIQTICEKTKKDKSESALKRWQRPGQKEAQSELMQEIHNQPEMKEKTSKRMIKRWKDPEYRDKATKAIQEAHNTPDMIEKKRQSALEQWERPGERERRCESMKRVQQEIVARPDYVNPFQGKHHTQETIDKISESRTGKCCGKDNPSWNGGKQQYTCEYCGELFEAYPSTNPQFCSNECAMKAVGEKRRGSNNPNWQGGIANAPYPHEFNTELKQKILKRDGYKCQLCGATEDLMPHHIDYDKQNCEEWNLITLCRRCNSHVNYNRELYTLFFQTIIKSYCFVAIITQGRMSSGYNYKCVF